jgi:2-dehydro-3-deoxy-L-rhamnonate dehydrogenase (NAD+)
MTLAVDLSGRVALVTGGARGIGLAIARRLAKHGAAVAILDIDEEAGRRTAAELGVEFVFCDVSAAAEVDDALAQTEARLGAVTTLVSNARC